MAAKATRRPWGETPWQASALPPTPPVRRNPDVAIVGGGLTGISAALHLARRGVRAVVFEAGLIGDGASGRTGGIVLEGIATGVRQGAEDCVPALERLVTDLGIKCDLRLPGCWEIEHRRGHGAEALPWQDEGSPIRIARTVNGGTVDPRALLIGLARAAVDAGAVIHERSAIKRIILQDGPALESDNGVIRARYVVVAVNAWTGALVSDLPLIHSALTFACATEALDDATLREIGLAERIPFYTADLPYLWGRAINDGRVVFGAGLKYGAPQGLEQVDVGEGDSRAILARLEMRVRGLHPAMAKVRIVSRWAGPIAFTEDAVPLLGSHPKLPALMVAGAYAGHGVAFSVRAGALMASAIVDSQPLPAWGTLRR
jgi:gamma-glutamylputrescine oxidase